ncbi:PhoPQ-activated protein PqaA family protein [Armatimonas sp.]|uniref:PhoPQ-activated pathogenicity-related family protein n=1 Tax=Armatimonas sp. TaxID=1872638 RepID=UPI00286A664E|nr:PhoPQ-activated protein PqaA family protein [Armatimonas sp.]
MNRRCFLSSITGVALTSALPTVAMAEGGLKGYIARPEPVYKWEKRGEKKIAGGVLYELWLVSQTWHEHVWEHRLQLFLPDKVLSPDFCTLLNTGGGGGTEEELIGMLAAQNTKSAFAILYHIPKQPLYGGLTEDALIVYTWQRFLETGDDTWPLHFPMAKAVIKAMDALQAFRPELKRFLITGASKRGWTTWLVGASGDKRVVAIAPMVIDILHVEKQIPHQLAMYGKPSEQVADYTAVGFDKLLLAPRGKELMKLEDPISYKNQLTLPKLILLGTNDRYWSQDALNLYWDDLKGAKWVLYMPNSGHGLEDRGRLLTTLSAFARTLAQKKKWPTPTWKWSGSGRTAELAIQSDVPLKSARLFRCTSMTTDFRDSKWTSEEIVISGNRATGRYQAPETGFAATYGELTYEIELGKPFTLATQMKILGK